MEILGLEFDGLLELIVFIIEKGIAVALVIAFFSILQNAIKANNEGKSIGLHVFCMILCIVCALLCFITEPTHSYRTVTAD